MRRFLLALGLVLASSPALADATAQRITPGTTLSLQGQLLELSAPICYPAAGSYAVLYRNSIATGCTLRSVGGSDAMATLVFTGAAAATYTMPASSVTTFTGSISGTTLTTPSNAVSIGSAITGVGVLDNTYVVSGGPTSWVVNNSQTVGSETLTQSVFPPGYGVCFINLGTAPQTITATTSLILPAPGVVNGNPAATGGPIVLYPEGEVCLQADPNNNYLPSGFIPGSWYQGAGSGITSLTWDGLSGYPDLHLKCRAVGTAGSGGLMVQLAYNGVFQTSGYTFVGTINSVGRSSFGPTLEDSTVATGFDITFGDPSANGNNGGDLDMDFSFANGTGMGFNNSVKWNIRFYDPVAFGVPNEVQISAAGTAPLTTSSPVTAIKLFFTSGTGNGMCWLAPGAGR